MAEIRAKGAPVNWLKQFASEAGSCQTCARRNLFVYVNDGVRLCRSCIRDAWRGTR